MKRLLNIEKNEHMRIEVSYQLGGMNYFSGKPESRGLRIHFNTIEVGEQFIRCSPMSNSSFKIFFQPLSRNSTKKISEAETWLENNKDTLFDMYENLDKHGLLEFVQSEHIKSINVA